jgi:AbrB family looped-hinge helix DNA binding protein
MARVTVSAKGWVVIPASCRRKYDIHTGSQLELVDYGGGLSLVPVPDHPVKSSRGLLKGKGSLTRRLLRERAGDRKREARR